MLSLRAIAVTRGGVPVLSDVSFDLGAGEAVILRGPNGSGKTTLLRTIARLQPPLSGEILGEVDDIAYAAHADGIKGALSVAENLRFWADVFGTGAIDAALSAFDLRGLRDRAAQHLSAGQKRRLGLARLLVTGRRIWALDEPTVSLDAASVALFADALQGHLTAGGAAIIATHIDLGFDARVIDVSAFRAVACDDFDGAFL
ncbi:heme ABC exporter ATP-binding protein CcmA [Oceaniglobus ichthyenteri]|uniref:heme ABC exporter ATP-binding protein CcmA n=1 Tax=Oceaniglobus ichthyenteri TaxID=2136177 RepID=UPI000D38BEC7|nr:heme ABC exporter ATP-binding protein CcmA [Oceaniglobus ichthyenteri]